MTLRLRAGCSAPISVHLLRTGMGRLKKDETALLGTARHPVYVREVLLCAGDQPVLAARTVCVSRRLRSWLAILGTQPLGERLFATGTAQWSVRDYARITPSSEIHAFVRQSAGLGLHACWARRSLYFLERSPMLVTEIFLPALFVQCGGSRSSGVTGTKLKNHYQQILRNI